MTAYSGACSGKTVDVYARATDAGANLMAWQRIPTTLSPGATVNGAAWQPPAMRTLTYSGFAVGDQIQSQFFVTGGTGIVALDYNTSSDPIATSGPLTISRPTIGATPDLLLAIAITLPRFRLAAIQLPLPADTLDASRLPPVIDDMSASASSHELSWTVDLAQPTSPVVILAGASLVQPDTTEVEWLAFVPAQRQHVAFPALPASLVAISPDVGTSWSLASGFGVARASADYATIVSTIDAEIGGLLVAGIRPGTSITAFATDAPLLRPR
jgi:hypothetical protein